MSISSNTVAGKIKYKMVLIGDSGVGKSAIIDRFMNDQFDEKHHPTIGIDFLVRNLAHCGKTYRLQVWDTAGQERFRALIPGYLKDAHCAIVVYDVEKPKSLENVERWIQLFDDNKPSFAACVLVGNKDDLSRNNTEKLLPPILTNFKIKHFYVSAKTSAGITEMFTNVIDIINSQSTVAITTTQQSADTPSEQTFPTAGKGAAKYGPLSNDISNAHFETMTGSQVVSNEGVTLMDDKPEKKTKCCGCF